MIGLKEEKRREEKRREEKRREEGEGIKINAFRKQFKRIRI
jgi:hypothetical protein